VNAGDIKCALKSIEQSDSMDCNSMNYCHLLFAHPMVLVSLSLHFNTILSMVKYLMGLEAAFYSSAKDKSQGFVTLLTTALSVVCPLLSKYLSVV
jgi:hypothetical protein